MSTVGALRASQGPGRLSAVLIIAFFCAATIPTVDMPMGTYVINRGAVKGTRPPGGLCPLVGWRKSQRGRSRALVGALGAQVGFLVRCLL